MGFGGLGVGGGSGPCRRADVFVARVAEELCVYDGVGLRAHVLNETSAWVWERCDGGRSEDDLVEELCRERPQLTLRAARAVVGDALVQLHDAALLVGDGVPVRSGLSRRRLLGLGVAAALVPVVQSIGVPSAAAQTSGPGPTTTTTMPPRAPRAYVANGTSGNVSVIDTASNTVTATITVGSNPYGVAVNPAGTRAYITNYGSGNVSVIDTASNTVTATITVGSTPYGVAVNPAGTRAYITNYGSN
ncbi:MAG: PqqD family peptide modification chaperone, partial [Planctomycetes bacterium]|nr:PqqD family peptide modification chaperone [Planctomycetota bacterium]